MFGHSDNHWVSKATMRDQVAQVERYRQEVVAEKGYDADQKMIILWDVYCRHRDRDLLDHIKEDYPNIIVPFVPANLTELCQPLDIYFNAEFKMKSATIRNNRIAMMFEKWHLAEAARIGALPPEERAAARENSTQFIVPTSLTHTKNWFYEDLALAIEQMQTVEIKEKLKNIAFKDLQRCFDREFQVEAVGKVQADRTGKYYFKLVDGNNIPADSAVERFEQSITFDAIAAH